MVKTREALPSKSHPTSVSLASSTASPTTKLYTIHPSATPASAHTNTVLTIPPMANESINVHVLSDNLPFVDDIMSESSSNPPSNDAVDFVAAPKMPV